MSLNLTLDGPENEPSVDLWQTPTEVTRRLVVDAASPVTYQVAEGYLEWARQVRGLPPVTPRARCAAALPDAEAWVAGDKTLPEWRGKMVELRVLLDPQRVVLDAGAQGFTFSWV